MAKRGVAPVLAAALLIAAFAATRPGVQAIGVCYGVIGSGLSTTPSKSDVVQLYKSNGIANMRFYFADQDLLNALRGSGIGLALDVGNDKLGDLAGDPATAAAWVNDNVQAYYPDVNFRYIVVGNEVDGEASVLQAMQNVHDALVSAGLDGSIKVSTAVKMDTIVNSSPPSDGAFSDPSVMTPIVQFLAGNGAPLLVNVYPYFAYKFNDGIDLNFALFEPSSTTVADPNGLTYTNLFDAMVDAVHAALDKVGFGGVDVVVSESGWPSADGKGASVDNARTYNQNVINHAGQGTPRKPGPMEVFVFALFNEDQKDGDPTEKKFGLFNPDMTPSNGVCYGMVADDLPPPSEVVQLYKSLGVRNMRLYSPDSQVMDALRGSGIGLILGVVNEDIANLAGCQSCATNWVMTNVKPYYPAVNIMYLAVGNEISAGEAARSVLPAMNNLLIALAAAGLAGIKVSTAVRFDVVANSFPPSSGVFAQGYMVDIARFVANTGAPLLVNVYPYFAYSGNPNDISLNYATFQPGTIVKDSGNGLVYTNLFDAMVDAVVAALEKAAAGSVKVVVSESGWPSAGAAAASVQNAQTYVQNLINHAAQGTPKRPGALETFVFAMFNEDRKPGEATEQNFGLFYPNKSPVYPITFR
ncbi:hypothetical protein HU200_065488 [Digitaria exilis]|uniref:Beta-1,3-glucanase n=1 Tax=Digitaria exilis TaxID=1010633 RepID=A0A835A9H7_9POAL|nr:hypothetical protein HU200_065488 [Digitaria exilis]CAB3475402.1 unnamed protein product [Digitaria exilis]